MRDEQALRLRYRIPNANSGALTIDTNLFPYDPLHQTFINVYDEGELRQQVIFNAETSAHVYYRGTTQGAIEVMKTFIPSGTHHILIGPDHILFLIGLLLLGGTWGALVRIVTAFTIGHSITLVAGRSRHRDASAQHHRARHRAEHRLRGRRQPRAGVTAAICARGWRSSSASCTGSASPTCFASSACRVRRSAGRSFRSTSASRSVS